MPLFRNFLYIFLFQLSFSNCFSQSFFSSVDSSKNVSIELKSGSNIFIADSVARTEAHFKRKKIISAILAFPLPFGILGVHRIYLGTKPYMPYVYIGTGGGCVGIIPLIDFIAILSANKKTFQSFENNPRV